MYPSIRISILFLNIKFEINPIKEEKERQRKKQINDRK